MTPPLPSHEATDRWYYSDGSNEPVGPFQFTALRALAASGVVLDATFVICEGESEWQKFGDVANTHSANGTPSIAAEPKQNPTTEGRTKLVGAIPKTQDWLSKNWRRPAVLAVIALLAFTSFAAVALALLMPFLSAVRHVSPPAPRILDNASFDGIVPRGRAIYADEQAYRETASNWREDQYPALPGPSVAVEGKIALYESKPETAAAVREREKSEAVWEQMEKQGRVWSESFDVPLRIVREKADFGAVLVEPAKGFQLRGSPVWVSKSSFYPRSHPLTKGWSSKRFVSQARLKFVFTGTNYAHVGGVYVKNTSDMLTGIFEGKISIEEAKRYAFTEAIVSAGLETVLKDYLIYETPIGPRSRAEFALRRNRTIEAGRTGIPESELDSRDDIFDAYNPLLGGPVIICDEAEFTTRGGFVKRLPVLEIVNLIP